MDRLLTAPRRPAEDPAADVDAPRSDVRPGVRRSPRASRRRPDAPARAERSPADWPVRRIACSVLVGALAMFAVSVLDTFGNTTVPVLGSFAALPAPPPERSAAVEVPPPPSDPGTCLNWTRPDAADTEVVDCAEPHLFEQAGTVVLGDQTDLPDDRAWRQLVRERCTPVVLDYLGGPLDPDGRFRVGALKPSPAKWAEGDRELRCGLQTASRSGALYPISGKVAGQDQSAVHEPGTCLAIDGRTIGDPVDCARPHAVETVGVVDLAAKFSDDFPEVGKQDEHLQPECARIAGEYAGGAKAVTDKGLTVYWDNLTEESWEAGTRRVNCNLAALLPDRSGFAPVTGSVRGDVVVGDTPAPPAGDAPAPGTPAGGPAGPSDEEEEPASEPSVSPTPTPEPTEPAEEAPPVPGTDTPALPPVPSLPAEPTEPADVSKNPLEAAVDDLFGTGG